MYRDLLMQTNLIMLPIAALVIFVGVYVFVVMRELFRAGHETIELATIPLQSEDRDGA